LALSCCRRVNPEAANESWTIGFLAGELFFRWIKHHLHMQAFYGTSENAVKTQVWVAMTVYTLVAIIKKQLHLEHRTLYEILQILSVKIFEKTPISQGFFDFTNETEHGTPSKQLNLFGF
jgi:hypothetical protein